MGIYYITGAVVIFVIILGYMAIRIINKTFDDFDNDNER